MRTLLGLIVFLFIVNNLPKQAPVMESAGQEVHFVVTCEAEAEHVAEVAEVEQFGPTAEEHKVPKEYAEVPEEAVWTVTVDGREVDANKFIVDNYSRPWTHPGTIYDHLYDHGVRPSEIAGKPVTTLEKLHAAIHEADPNATRKVAAKVAAKAAPAKAPAKASYSNCPGGVCPSSSQGWFSGRRNRRSR